MQIYHFEIFADYYQFYLTDNDAEALMPEDVTDDNIRDRVWVAPHMLVVSAARNVRVPVTVELYEGVPPLDPSAWDHLVECSIAVPSGRLILAGCTDYLPDALRIPVHPGHHRARICFRGLGTLGGDGFEGDDDYIIQLWPATPTGLKVIEYYDD